jgi:hypothetical protein
MDKGKPALMLAVMDGLKKKGKLDSDAGSEPVEVDDSSRAHLEDIAKELISAVHDKDHIAVADLLEEAFECLDSQPHEEGPHLDSAKDSEY